MRNRSSLLRVLLVCLVATSGIAGSVGTVTAAGNTDAARTAGAARAGGEDGADVPRVAGGDRVRSARATETYVESTVTYRLTPQRPATVYVHVQLRIDPRVRSLRFRGTYGSVIGVRNVSAGLSVEGSFVVWDGSSREVSATLAIRRGPEHGDEYAITESWAMIYPVHTLPTVTLSDGRELELYPGHGVDQTQQVADEGYVSEYVLLGEHGTERFTADGREYTVVWPAEVGLGETQLARIRDSIIGAERYYLPTVDTPSTVLFVVPSPMRGGGATLNYGPTSFVWVNSNSIPRDPVATWSYGTRSSLTHEFVHTAQDFWTEPEMQWVVEGSASYYHSLLLLRRDRISYGRFHGVVNSSQYTGVVLSKRTTPAHGSHYSKGKRVLAALDAEIRIATDGERTLQDVMLALNAHRGPVSYADFQAIVEQVAGRSFDGWLDRYVAGSAVPTIPRDRSLYPPPDETRDTDGDGAPDLTELRNRSDPTLVDTDGDGLGDAAELSGPSSPSVADTDRDGLRDGVEATADTDPTLVDTDGDGLGDAAEVDGVSDPALADTDGDGLDDGQEVGLDSDPTVVDTDGDGLTDAEEHEYDEVLEAYRPISEPTSPDTDQDGLDDRKEVETLGTNPDDPDTDRDGVVDPVEVRRGTDPLRGPGIDRPGELVDWIVYHLVELTKPRS